MIDLSGLQEYVKLYPELLGKLMNRESILRYLAPHTGATPGKYRFRIWIPQTHFQPCCTIPKGGASVEERDAEVVCIQDGDEYCENDLSAILRESAQRWTAGNEKAPPKTEAVITQQQLASTQIELDKLVMLGDTASTEENLKPVDGIIKQTKDAGTAIEIDLTGITSPYEMIKAIVLAFSKNPDAYLFGNVQIFIGTDMAAVLQMELVGLDLYHYNPGVMDNFQPFTIPGLAKITVVPTFALDGTGIIFATPERNLHWLTNLTADHMSMLWDYDNYRQVYFWRIKFLLGLLVAFPEYVVMGTYDPDTISATTGINVNIISPLGDNGGVLTSDTPATRAVQTAAATAAVNKAIKEARTRWDAINEAAEIEKAVKSKSGFRAVKDTTAKRKQAVKDTNLDTTE